MVVEGAAAMVKEEEEGKTGDVGRWDVPSHGFWRGDRRGEEGPPFPSLSNPSIPRLAMLIHPF